MRVAENCNYWKTSRSSPDTWIEKAIDLIEKFGGTIIASGFGNEGGRAAYLIRFSLEGESFRILWPVLESETGDQFAARRQAATMLHHDVKAKCISAQVLGARVAFFSWAELPDGRVMFQVANADITKAAPKMLLSKRKGGPNGKG